MTEQVAYQLSGGGSIPTPSLQTKRRKPMLNFWVRENRLRDLYLKNPEGGVVFIPKGWCDEFYQDPEDVEIEIMTYCSVGLQENGPIDNLYIPVSRLDAMREIAEKEAREIHPVLFETLARINAGENITLG